MSEPLPPLPPLWPHQENAVEAIVEAFQRVSMVLLEGPVGCLAGETLINVNRGGKGTRNHFTIEQVYEKFNRLGSRKVWDSSIPTFVERCVVAPKWGPVVRLGQVKAVTYSGERQIFELRTADQSIRATADHRFALNGGEMVALSNLSVGDELLVDVGRGKARKDRPHKQAYRYTQGLVNHPQRGAWPYRQPLHRLVIEAEMNDLPLDWYIAILRDSRADTNSFCFLSPLEAVHHLDENTQNNDRSNLEVKGHLDHWRDHGLEGAWAHVAFQIGIGTVSSIVPAGMEPTFDIAVDDEPHNFIANGFVVHNSGKTIIGEAVRRQIAPEGKSVYVCSSKVLQEQVLRDRAFTHGRLLKGRANYTPLTSDRTTERQIDTLKINCDDCTWRGRQLPNGTIMAESHKCDFCDEREKCPYQVAARAARDADLAILNTHYWLAAANFAEMFQRRTMAIIDEADLLDQVITQYAEIRITKPRLRKLGLLPPKGKTPDSAKSWQEWINGSFNKVATRQKDRLAAAKAEKSGPEYIAMRRDQRWAESTLKKTQALANDLHEGKQASWVRVGGEEEVIWRPLWPTRHSESTLWQHADKWLLMSGTILSASELLDRLGWRKANPDRAYEFIQTPASIPAENRPIHYLPVADMTYKSTGDDYAKMVYACRQIAAVRHPQDRILIHTVSYHLMDRIADGLTGLGRRIIGYSNSQAAQTAIEEYKLHPNAILVAPSQERGLDLPGDLCRAMIIAKVPYLSLGDRQVAARLHPPGECHDYEGGQQWYSLEALRRIIQMTGRGVRGIDDRADSYILDRSFYHRLWKDVEGHAPGWWQEAIQWQPDASLLRLVGIIPEVSGAS